MSTQTAVDPNQVSAAGAPPDSPHLLMYLSLCMVQGLYYFGAGVWPLVSIASFQKVTGLKTDNWTGNEADHWLVNTVAVLVIAIGFTLIVAAWRRPPSIEAMLLAISSAIGLTAIDCVYVSRRVIEPIYLGDVLVEVGLIIAWGVYYARERRHRLSLAAVEAEAAATPEPARVLVTQTVCPPQPAARERV